jgi:hypothetical protein
MSSEGGRFDDIFNAVKDQQPEPIAESREAAIAESPTAKTAKEGKRPAARTSERAAVKGNKSQTKALDFWSDLEPEAQEATVRLNVDIPIRLNDKLAEKARKLRQPKTELVRKLIEWAMNDSSE